MKRMPQDTLRLAVLRVLRPLVRLLIGGGVPYPRAAEWLRALYIEVAEAAFRLPGKRMTDSRISLLTGVQRREVKAVRGQPAPEAPPESAGPLPRVLARWQGHAPYNTRPRLPRSAPAGVPSFEGLVAEVSQDIHPRTVLDELLRLGLVEPGPGDGELQLRSAAFVPGADGAALLGYLGANLGDHAEAAAANIAAAPGPGRFFERAVHYNRLSPASVAELDALARRLQSEALEALNARALELQEADEQAADTATLRFRCGAFVYHQDSRPEEETAP
ncbi:DUF6502 family protein [Oceanicella sp. SM1341]|uniref:DUF6502 family protein n=1 Tax=Oceanicella sp. SM1341 TaxID=1548889 RepID=UPI0013003A3A|nr:DUF6502 family protein [Oceanicella sp. SM1341]